MNSFYSHPPSSRIGTRNSAPLAPLPSKRIRQLDDRILSRIPAPPLWSADSEIQGMQDNPSIRERVPIPPAKKLQRVLRKNKQQRQEMNSSFHSRSSNCSFDNNENILDADKSRSFSPIPTSQFAYEDCCPSASRAKAA